MIFSFENIPSFSKYERLFSFNGQFNKLPINHKMSSGDKPRHEID